MAEFSPCWQDLHPRLKISVGDLVLLGCYDL